MKIHYWTGYDDSGLHRAPRLEMLYNTDLIIKYDTVRPYDIV